MDNLHVFLSSCWSPSSDIVALCSLSQYTRHLIPGILTESADRKGSLLALHRLFCNTRTLINRCFTGFVCVQRMDSQSYCAPFLSVLHPGHCRYYESSSLALSSILFLHANIGISMDIPFSCFTPKTSTSTDGRGSGGSSPSPMGTPTQTCPGSHWAATRAARLTVLTDMRDYID